jgi:arylsulfatase A
VVLIFTDDQGYADLSCFGSETIKTPHLDKLAAQGRKMTSVVVPSPVCSPSRTGLLTGCYPKRVSMHRHVLFPTSDYGLHPSEMTIADHLKAAGFATACVGKWHLGHHPEVLPTAQGFDSYFGIPYSNDMNHPDNKGKVHPAADEGWLNQDEWVKKWNTPLMRGTEIIEIPCNQRTITRRYTDEAIRFVEENKDRPFFLYLPHSMPHIPLFVPEDASDPDVKNAYTATIQHIDAECGRLFDRIEQLGLSGNTYIIFTTDNGPWLQFKHHGGSAKPLRAGKGTTFEGGQRVPFIIRGPGIPAGSTSNELISTIDLPTTIGTLTGHPFNPEKPVDGLDVSTVLTTGGESPRREFLYYNSQGLLEGIRQGDWKLLIPAASKKPNANQKAKPQAAMLFNLASDLSEANNLASQQPERVENMRQRMRAMDEAIEQSMRPVWKKNG